MVPLKAPRPAAVLHRQTTRLANTQALLSKTLISPMPSECLNLRDTIVALGEAKKPEVLFPVVAKAFLISWAHNHLSKFFKMKPQMNTDNLSASNRSASAVPNTFKPDFCNRMSNLCF
jgi:hypothetical protein